VSLDNVNQRVLRLKQRFRKQIASEYETLFENFRNREDYLPEIEHFLEVLKYSVHPEEMQKRLNDKVVLTLCIQAPLELFFASGMRVFKLACGSFAAQHLAIGQLPSLTCPMMKSVIGMLNSRDDADVVPYKTVFPTTCDWVVKFSELTGMDETGNFHMELPHMREKETSSRRWLEEVYALKKWLEQISGKKISKKKLNHAVSIFMKAYYEFSKLIELRRLQKVPSVHFAAITNSMVYDDIHEWIIHVNRYISGLNPIPKEKMPVFLAGSPILFPNYKLLKLIEDAGMNVVADDLCSMERVFPGATCYEDRSEYGLMRALAERNHKACICPTFSDNQRRVNSMNNVLQKENIKGIVYHVLKGCHPYDIESVIIEKKLKALGYRFLKIETDYVEEDEQNVVTRLEAFRQTLE
jgi:benzoyl-CoA reductase/2-hydroxyglutaryl-CoA dehydratase subunit BcrC/BadD/HgdB